MSGRDKLIGETLLAVEKMIRQGTEQGTSPAIIARGIVPLVDCAAALARVGKV